MNLTAEARFKLDIMTKFINLDFTQEMLEGGEKFVAGQIRQNIRTGTDVEGNPFIDLKPETVEYKKSKGYNQPNKPLVATGMLRDDSIGATVITTNVVKIAVLNTLRKRIAEYHQYGDGSLPKRAFFGIAQKDEDRVKRQVLLVMIKKIDRLTR